MTVILRYLRAVGGNTPAALFHSIVTYGVRFHCFLHDR